jgi:oligoribonuclease (3'-5' exoribonuclease)
MFKDEWMDEQMFTMKSEVVDHLSRIMDDLFKVLTQKICERRRFIISELLCEFPQISHTVPYKIITVRLGCDKFCARWIPKMLMGAHKTQRMGLGFDFDFFRAIQQRWQ